MGVLFSAQASVLSVMINVTEGNRSPLCPFKPLAVQFLILLDIRPLCAQAAVQAPSLLSHCKATHGPCHTVSPAEKGLAVTPYTVGTCTFGGVFLNSSHGLMACVLEAMPRSNQHPCESPASSPINPKSMRVLWDLST